MAENKKTSMNWWHFLAGAALQSPKLRYAEPLAGGLLDGKGQPGEGLDDKPVLREDRDIASIPYMG